MTPPWLQPPLSNYPDDIRGRAASWGRVGEGGSGPTSFTWEFSFLKKQCSKALWRMQRLVGNGGDEGSAKVSKGRRGGEGGAGRVSMEGVGSGPGLQTDS